MKYRIRSTAKATWLGQNSQPLTKIIHVDEILEFEHEPSDEEVQRAFEKHSAYAQYSLQWIELFEVKKI
jgi:hypothetical protein